MRKSFLQHQRAILESVIDERVRQWAAESLADLARHLNVSEVEAQALRELGVSETRVRNLYPFNPQDWEVAAYELLIGPTDPQGLRQQVSALISRWETAPLTIARSFRERPVHVMLAMQRAGAAYVAEGPKTLLLIICVLQAIAHEGITIATSPGASQRFTEKYPDFVLLINNLRAILSEHNWVAESASRF